MFQTKSSLTLKGFFVILGLLLSGPLMADADELPESLAQVRSAMNRANVMQARIVVAKDGAVVVLSGERVLLFFDRTGHHMHLQGSNPKLAREIAERRGAISDVKVSLHVGGRLKVTGDIVQDSPTTDRHGFYESIRDHQNGHPLDMVAVKKVFQVEEAPPPFTKILEVMKDEEWSEAHLRLHPEGVIGVKSHGDLIRVLNPEGIPFPRGEVPVHFEKIAKSIDYVGSVRMKVENREVTFDGFLRVDQADRVGEDRSGLLAELTFAMNVPKGYGPKVAPERESSQRRGCLLQTSILAGVAALGIGIYAIAREVGKKKEEMRKKMRRKLEKNKTLQLPGGYPPGWALSR